MDHEGTMWEYLKGLRLPQRKCLLETLRKSSTLYALALMLSTLDYIYACFASKGQIPDASMVRAWLVLVHVHVPFEYPGSNVGLPKKYCKKYLRSNASSTVQLPYCYRTVTVLPLTFLSCIITCIHVCVQI